MDYLGWTIVVMGETDLPAEIAEKFIRCSKKRKQLIKITFILVQRTFTVEQKERKSFLDLCLPHFFV